jgi:hypothetical protein
MNPLSFVNINTQYNILLDLSDEIIAYVRENMGDEFGLKIIEANENIFNVYLGIFYNLYLYYQPIDVEYMNY